jgi:hypothetical protein
MSGEMSAPPPPQRTALASIGANSEAIWRTVASAASPRASGGAVGAALRAAAAARRACAP